MSVAALIDHAGAILVAGGLLDQRRSTDEPEVANEDIDFSLLADAGLLDSGERQVWKKMRIYNS